MENPMTVNVRRLRQILVLVLIIPFRLTALEAFFPKREIVRGALQAFPIPRTSIRHARWGFISCIIRLLSWALLAYIAKGEVVVVTLRAIPVTLAHRSFLLRDLALKTLLAAGEIVAFAGLTPPIPGTSLVVHTVVVTLKSRNREPIRGVALETRPAGGEIVMAAFTHPVAGLRVVTASVVRGVVPTAPSRIRYRLGSIAVETIVAEGEIVRVTELTYPVPGAGIATSTA